MISIATVSYIYYQNNAHSDVLCEIVAIPVLLKIVFQLYIGFLQIYCSICVYNDSPCLANGMSCAVASI